jgi:GntR family transcriptional repressor for pyruvate dehydrogenase complex
MGSVVFHFPEQKDLLIDLTKTRRIIESQAIYDIAANPPKGFVAQFAKLIEELDLKADENKIDAYNMLDFELHKSIINATENKILISLYTHLTSLLIRSFSKTGYVRGSLETSIADHHKMLEAIVIKDSDLAKKTMESHIMLTLMKVENLDDAAGR